VYQGRLARSAQWHAPIWFSGQWSTPGIPNIAVYVFWIVAVTFIFTWGFNNTRDSVFMAILLHGTMDVFPNAFLLVRLPGAAGTTSSGVISMYWGWRSASARSRCCSSSSRAAGWEAGRTRVTGRRAPLGRRPIGSRVPWTSARAAP
jgi:hypothetical protein